jgi:hypothetical protein
LLHTKIFGKTLSDVGAAIAASTPWLLSAAFVMYVQEDRQIGKGIGVKMKMARFWRNVFNFV